MRVGAVWRAVCATILCAASTAATAECLKAEVEGQVAQGRLERVRFVDVDYGNRVEIAYILNLAQPACLEGEDEYDKIESTLKIHVYSMDKPILQRLEANIGRQIRVLGWAFGEHTIHHRAPIVMNITAVKTLP
ncbi:MAG TPA: hypothetical protein VKT73_06940 [Xanthobacteraceae bacterium]|nr:hypothetical protein [Xanthobacteraceae bacterium]